MMKPLTILLAFLPIAALGAENLPSKKYLNLAAIKTMVAAAEAEAAMTVIMTGQATQAQIGAYLAALRMKGETIEEVVGSARAMRAVSSHVCLHLHGEEAIDIVGTGGDGAHTFNISTTAALIVAAVGAVPEAGDPPGFHIAADQCRLARPGIPLNQKKTVARQTTAENVVKSFHPAGESLVAVVAAGSRLVFSFLAHKRECVAGDFQTDGIHARLRRSIAKDHELCATLTRESHVTWAGAIEPIPDPHSAAAERK